MISPARRDPIVHHYYARYLAHPSGVTDSLNHWAEALSRAGIDSSILCAGRPRSSPGNEFADTAHVQPIFHFGEGRVTWIPAGLFSRLKKGDLLVLHEGWVLSNLVAALVAFLKRVKYVVVPHGVYEQGIAKHIADFGGVRRRAERVLLRHAAAVHVFYAGEETVLTDFEPAIRRFITVPNGAPPSSAADQWRGGGDYFLWLGRFDPHHKGLDNLLRFWARLSEPRPRLILAGPDFRDGRQEVAAMIKDLELTGTVELRGRVSGQEKIDLTRDARAYLHPSRWESCSIMLLEMLSAGTPSMISKTIHAAAELEPIGVVHATDFSSAEQFADDTLKVVDRSRALGENSRNWARESGSWAIVGEEYARELRRLNIVEAHQ